MKIIRKKKNQKLKKILPRNISEVININNNVRYKIKAEYI